MKKQTWFTGVVISITILAGLVIVGLTVNAGNAVNNRMGSVPSINILSAGKGCDKNLVAAQALREKGFVDGEFVLGEDQIDWSAPEANERGDGAFVKTTPQTAEEVVEELGQDSKKAQAASTTLREESGATQEQVVTPDNWVPAQLKVGSTLDENTQFRDGQAVNAGVRNSDSGDVIWLFVRPDVCILVMQGEAPADDAVTGHRAGCGNPQGELPRPTKPKTPPPTVVIITTTTTTRPVTTTTTTCNKPPKPAVTDDRYDWVWNAAACKWEKRDNPFYQPPQNNPGQNTGPTPGAPQQPTVPPTGPPPPAGQPAPAPTPGGTDSGSPTQYPGGTTTDPGGTTTGGGPTGPTGGTPPTVDDGTHGGDPGGF